jgi:hypothetical protein
MPRLMSKPFLNTFDLLVRVRGPVPEKYKIRLIWLLRMKRDFLIRAI